MMTARTGTGACLDVRGVVVEVPGWATPETRRRVLDRVDLEVPHASVTVVTGPPGFGGTTLARVVAGLVTPTAGRVLIVGRDCTAEPPARRPVSFVPAGGGLLPHLTATENIVYGLQLRNEASVLIRTRVAEVVERLELGSSLELRPHELSPGQRLRTALARAAVRRPPLVVVDATAGADAVGQLRTMIDRIRVDDTPAILLCAHGSALVGPADHVVRLADGSVVTGGSVAADGSVATGGERG